MAPLATLSLASKSSHSRSANTLPATFSLRSSAARLRLEPSLRSRAPFTSLALLVSLARLHIRIGSCWQSPPTPYLSPYNDPPLCPTKLTHALSSTFNWERKISTFQYNNPVVSELIWLELEFNLSYPYFEKRSLYCQCSTHVGANVTVRNQSNYENDGCYRKWTNVSTFH